MSQELKYHFNGRDYTPEEWAQLHPVEASNSNIALAHSAFRSTAIKSDTQQILEAIAALAAGLTARDRQLSAISEQIGDLAGYVQATQGRVFDIETAIKVLGERVETALWMVAAPKQKQRKGRRK